MTSLEEEILKHDPTGSFDRDEIQGIMVMMEMPVTIWADAVRNGTASSAQVKEWMDRLDAIKPGYGQYFLGDVVKTEEEQLEGTVRRPVNWKKEGGRYVPFYGEPRTGMEPVFPASGTIHHTAARHDVNVATVKMEAEEYATEHAFDWTEKVPQTPEQLDAWKKLQDAKYEYMKSQMGENDGSETDETDSE